MSSSRFRFVWLLLGLMACTIPVLSSVGRKAEVVSNEAIKKQLLSFLNHPTREGLNSYFVHMDHLIVELLNQEKPLAEIEATLMKLTHVNPTLVHPWYQIIRLDTKDGPVYVGNYQVSYFQGSALRIYQKEGNTFSVVFSFTPMTQHRDDLEEPLTVVQCYEGQRAIRIAAVCGGETSGFSPPGSLFVWEYDPAKRVAVERLRLLNKNGLFWIPLEGKSDLVAVSYDELTADKTAIKETIQEWFDVRENFALMGRYLLKQLPAEKGAGH